MTERITAADVEKVAKLARLRLTDEELQRFTSQLGDVLEHAADLQSLDLDGVAPMAHPVHLRTQWGAGYVFDPEAQP